MKRLRPIQLAATLMVMLVPLALSAVNTIIHTVNYSSSGMTVGTDTLGGVTYTTVNYGELFNSGEPGKPSLPVDYLKFSVPYNATNFSVTATLSNNMTQYIDHLVYPCQPPRMMSDTTPVVITLPDSATYYSNSFYPSQAAWVVDEGFLAGENHIVTVAVMPIAYKHTKGKITSRDELRRSGTVRLTLRYDLSDSLAMYPIVRNDTALRNEGHRLTQSMVVNPTNVDAYAPDIYMDTMMVINPNSGDGLNVDPPHSIDDLIDPNPIEMHEVSYPYLIVTTPELKRSLRRLAALKRQKGYGVQIVTMDDVINDTIAILGDRIRHADGSYHIAYNDDAGKLRQFLKIYYGIYGTQFVLLAGDVPYRYFSSTMNEFEPQRFNIPTDLYYADLNGGWSIYSYDFQPELYVGRLIAKRPEQIANYTDKLFRYEIDPGNGDASYLSRAFASFGHDNYTGGEWYNTQTRINQLFSFYDYILESEDELIFPSGNHIIDSINEHRYGFISLNHHGCPSGLITYGRRNYGGNKDRMRFLWAIDTVKVMAGVQSYLCEDTSVGNGLNNLTNRNYPDICYSTGCITMPYDTDTITDYSSIPMNFGESFTTGKDYGGPAFIGNTRNAITPATGELESLFFKQLINGYDNIGMANGLAKADGRTWIVDTVSKKYMPLTQNLLGDPEFEIWTDTPQEFTNIQVTRSDNRISVSVGNTNSAIVACYSNDGKWRKTTTSSSVVFNGMSPNSTVMVYKHNYIPYIAPLLLQNVELSKSQYVIASDVTAGYAIDIDSNRTQGDVTVKSGVEYEIETSGTVTFQGGFKVEKGATFAVYPSCF